MKSRKSDKGILKTSPLHLKSKKEKLLARWTDGLFYFVKIIKISDANKTCVVEFEDKSTCKVHFKDLLQEKEDGKEECYYCGKDAESSSETLIQCSNCERDYHLSCHIPPIEPSEDTENFVCRICVFASCAQAGGAKRSGPLAEKYATMKQHFPYDMKYLTWNATHTSNVEQCFCYCGGPGIWYNKMLQCCRCRQWFHEACVQCLDEELLLGDRFFIYACARCNQGEEFIQRMDLSWFDITYISVFHLIMTVGKRYADLDGDIVPFVMSQAHSFGLKKLLNGHHGSVDAIRSELLKMLSKHNSLFCCGSEVKKRCTYFGMRERIPPCPPSFSIPASDEKITFETLSRGSGKKTTFTPIKFLIQVPYVLRGASKVIPPTMGAKLKESRLAKIARVKSEHNYCTPIKSQETSPSRKRVHLSPPRRGAELYEETFDTNNNSPSKQLPVKTEPEDFDEAEHIDVENICNRANLPSTSEARLEGKPFWSLDTAFPEPPNFMGPNHPFLTEFEQENLRKQRRHFESELERLSSLLNEEVKDDPKGPPIVSPVGKDVKGFKGELAELINSCGSNSSTPRKARRSIQTNDLTPDKLLAKLSPPRNGILSRRNRSPSQSSKERLSRGSSQSPSFVNGVKISPRLNRNSLKNGFTLGKSESLASKESMDVLDPVAQKRLKALNRCLKNLTPTCGFHFPVLEESHPAVVNFTAGPVNDSSKPPNGLSASFLAAASSNSRSNTSSLSQHSGKKGRKRKHEVVDQIAEDSASSQQCQNSENVRRSHRSRSSVKRFEACLGPKTHFKTMEHSSSGRGEADQYDVVSLRVGFEDAVVEYLVNWSQ